MQQRAYSNESLNRSPTTTFNTRKLRILIWKLMLKNHQRHLHVYMVDMHATSIDSNYHSLSFIHTCSHFHICISPHSMQLKWYECTRSCWCWNSLKCDAIFSLYMCIIMCVWWWKFASIYNDGKRNESHCSDFYCRLLALRYIHIIHISL